MLTMTSTTLSTSLWHSSAPGTVASGGRSPPARQPLRRDPDWRRGDHQDGSSRTYLLDDMEDEPLTVRTAEGLVVDSGTASVSGVVAHVAACTGS